MLEIKDEYSGKVKSIYFFFIIAIISLTLEKSFNIKSEIIFILNLILLSMAIIIFLISRVKIKNKRINNLNYIGLAFLYISIGRFLDLENINQIYTNRKNVDFFQLISYLEIINIIAAFILFKFKASNKVQHITYNLILIILFNLSEHKLYLFNTSNEIRSYLINFILKAILLIIYFNLIKRHSEHIKCKKDIYIILAGMIFISIILEVINNIFNIDLILLIKLVKTYTYIIIYKTIEEIIYISTYSKAEFDLIKGLNKKREKNKKLKLREKELIETSKNLEKSEEKYYNILRTFYDVVIIFDNNKIVYSNYFNEYFKDKIKENKYKYENMDIDFILKRIFKDNHKDKYDEIKGKEEFFVVIENKEEDSSKSILEIELKKLYDNKKIIYINDITENVNKKEEIIKLGYEINKGKIKEEFYTNISHELRTPINVIYSGLQLNSIYIKNREIEKIRKNNKLIKQNCLRLIRTVNNFIDSNKLSENKLYLNKKVYNMVNIIDNIVLACDYYMKQKNIKVTFDPEFEEVYMLCDKNHIERIMLNILSNSLKYGKEFGNIFLTLLIEEENIIIEVMNDAEAIEESKRKMIFEQFTKINNSLNRTSEGSGLGLFLTKELVELSGGNIEIISGKEIGNIFKMTLPYNKEIIKDEDLVNKELEINELKEKVDIEFSDIYFNI